MSKLGVFGMRDPQGNFIVSSSISNSKGEDLECNWCGRKIRKRARYRFSRRDWDEERERYAYNWPVHEGCAEEIVDGAYS